MAEFFIFCPRLECLKAGSFTILVTVEVSKESTLALGPTHSPIQWVPGALFPELGREADHVSQI